MKTEMFLSEGTSRNVLHIAVPEAGEQGAGHIVLMTQSVCGCNPQAVVLSKKTCKALGKKLMDLAEGMPAKKTRARP